MPAYSMIGSESGTASTDGLVCLAVGITRNNVSVFHGGKKRKTVFVFHGGKPSGGPNEVRW